MIDGDILALSLHILAFARNMEASEEHRVDAHIQVDASINAV